MAPHRPDCLCWHSASSLTLLPSQQQRVQCGSTSLGYVKEQSHQNCWLSTSLPSRGAYPVDPFLRADYAELGREEASRAVLVQLGARFAVRRISVDLAISAGAFRFCLMSGAPHSTRTATKVDASSKLQLGLPAGVTDCMRVWQLPGINSWLGMSEFLPSTVPIVCAGFQT